LPLVRATPTLRGHRLLTRVFPAAGRPNHGAPDAVCAAAPLSRRFPMTPRSWLRTLFRPKARPLAARPRARLRLEALEDRLAPATFTVTSNADDPTLGENSLRAAVASIEHGADQNANIQRTGAYGANDIILFNLPPDQRTITLASNDANLAFGPTALVVTA